MNPRLLYRSTFSALDAGFRLYHKSYKQRIRPAIETK
jgi:hypothetical protein